LLRQLLLGKSSSFFFNLLNCYAASFLLPPPPPPPSPHALLEPQFQFLCHRTAGDKSTQLRMDSLLQLPLRLTSWLVAEATFSAGFVHSLSSHAVSIADRFFMGGPLDLRGYKYYSVGPSEPLLTPKPVYVDAPLRSGEAQGPTCPVGALGSWMGGLHLYSPLPFWGEARESVASLFRLHAFAMAGSLLADPIRAFKVARNQGGQLDRFLQLLDFQPRYVLGAGLILRFVNVARLELNYCLPVNPQPDDAPQAGFQVGIGLSYM
uniref:Bac_surface_Ag domain-containing protein n=1 Tax=Mesocestoides corti TaxID=53468 RepID=A0A5K3F7L0_MESCO